MSNKFILINRDQLFVILVHPVGHAFYARHTRHEQKQYEG